MISFFPTLHCVALGCKQTREVNRDYTVPHLVSGTVIAQFKASASLNDGVVLDHSVLLLWTSFTSMCCYIFYLHIEFCWFYVTFHFGKRKEMKFQKRVIVKCSLLTKSSVVFVHC